MPEDIEDDDHHEEADDDPEDRGQDERQEDVAEDPADLDGRGTDRDGHRAEQPTDERVTRRARDPEPPGDEIPDDRPDERRGDDGLTGRARWRVGKAR